MINVKKGSWRNIIKNLYVFGILAIFIIIFAAISPKFIAMPSIINIIRTAAPIVIVSAAATLLMISGNLDLSVGSMLGLSGIVCALLTKSGVSLFAAVIICMLLGIVLGAINGLLVVKLKIIPVIATLATMNVFLGVAKLLSGDTIPYVKGMPKDFAFLGRGDVGGIPIQLFIIVAVVVLFILLQRKSILGKYAVAIGGNPVAAKLAGINVNKIIWIMYILVGVVSALAGCVRASNMTVADATAGIGFELDVIIAILMGGTSFFGGEGSVGRTVAGAFILVILTIGLNMAGVQSFYQYLVKGLVLIVAVFLDKIVKEKISA